MAPDLIPLDALGPAGAYRARKRVPVPDVTGKPVAELSLVPSLYINRAMTGLRNAPSLPREERATALALAARIFIEETIGGLSFTDYVHVVSRVSGVPISVIRSAATDIAAAADQADTSAYQAQPAGAAADWRDPATRVGKGVWTRRGEVLAIHAAGNHPGPHELWLEALALGYRVAVRPSRREPFTAHRLVWALRAAGFGENRVALLPTDHDTAQEILECADLGVVYGGDDVVRRHATDRTVLPQGPGRSKILLTADVDWHDHLDTIIDSISHHGGVACLNTTAVLVEGDPAPVAHAIAQRLAELPNLPPEDDRAMLPVKPIADANALQQYLYTQTKDCTPWLGGESIVDELGDGSAVLRPAVHQVDESTMDRIGVELPFPCVWVAPWTPHAGLGPLTNTLVLTAITGDDTVMDALLDEPTISNVYRGDHPTYWMRPGVPHDGYLGEFLMHSKAVVRG
jgi:acyl-CoA reductase-like NAD-dependent aldehyde dehydrogenase